MLSELKYLVLSFTSDAVNKLLPYRALVETDDPITIPELNIFIFNNILLNMTNRNKCVFDQRNIGRELLHC